MNHTRPLGARQDRFTQLPDILIDVLGPRQHQLVHALLSYDWTGDGAIYPSVPTLAMRLRWSVRTVQRALRSLEDQGYIVTEARYRDDQGRTSNLYRPGPALIAHLSPRGRQPDTTPVTARHPAPMTRVSDERRNPDRYEAKQRQAMGRYITPPRSGSLMATRYGPYVRPERR
jgi:DNA-binding transcriptional MocR family regulator